MKTIKSLAAMLLAANLLASFAYGASVSYDDAKNVALNLIYSKTGKSVTIDDSVHDSGTDKELHIIRMKPKGWVIVSGDDSTEPVIAYSTESSLDSSDSLPAGFIAWMDTVEKQIQEAKKSGTQSSAALEEKWEKLTAYPDDFSLDGTSYQSNDGYVQDVILAVSPEGSDTSKNVTASGGVVADGWYVIDVTAGSSSVDDGEAVGADEPLTAAPPRPTTTTASDGTYEGYVLINNYGGAGVWHKIWRGNHVSMATRTRIAFTKESSYKDRDPRPTLGAPTAWYAVEACNNENDCSRLGPPDEGWPGKTTPPPTPTKPATPTNISASKGTYTTGVMISNYSVSNATGYKIYRNGISKGLTTGTRILDTTAELGKYYNYSVKANNSAGDSDMSAPDKGWRGYPTPAKPATPSVYATDGTLTSGVVIKFYSAKATSYKVYRNGMFIGATTTTSLKDTKAYPGRKYTYSAKACNSSGCSGLGYDTGWRAKPASTLPATPSVYATDGTLTSGVVIKFYSAKATSYKVYRNSMFIGATTTTSLKDTKAYPGRKYTYSAKACNSSGCSGLGYDSGWRKSDIPAVPKGVSATDGTLTSGVVIKWGSVSGAVQYLIYRDGGYVDATSATSYKDTKAYQDRKYNYSVKAKNSAGKKSAMSASDRGWRKGLPSPGNIKASITLTSGIVISNYKVNGATHYKIYRFHPSYSNPKLIKDTKYLSYKDTTAAYETKYSYYVTACNSGGCSVSSYAENGWRSRIGTPPPVPGNIDASDGLTSGIVLKGYSVSGANSYKFYRSTYSDGRNPTVLKVNSAPTSWKDTYAKPDTFYYYRVAACVTRDSYTTCSMPSSAVDRGWRRP